MASYARIKPTYVSLSCINNGLTVDSGGPYDTATAPLYASHGTVASGFIDAEDMTDYNVPLVEKASDYVCAIERMELSLNGIPFFDGTTIPYEAITIRSRLNGALFGTRLITNNAYSLPDLLTLLSNYSYPDPNNLPLGTFRMIFSLGDTGAIRLDLVGTDFTNVQVEFPRRLNLILGLTTNLVYQPNIAAPNQRTFMFSSIPRLDMGDDLQRIVITSNLPTNSDSIGNVRLPVLTDIGIETGSRYNSNLVQNGYFYTNNSWNMALRDKLIYIPNERRFLDLIGDFPITNVQIGVYYVNLDGTHKKVQLPFGGIFTVKIGFYLKQ